MIQRIQTVYLLVAAIVSIVCLCLPVGTYSADGMVVAREYNLFIAPHGADAGGYSFGVWPMFAVLLLSAAMAIYDIFKYANRHLQLRIGSFCVVMAVAWYVCYAIFALAKPSWLDAASFTPHLTAVLPLVSIIFYFMAMRSIRADEKLVRAADRIR